MKRRDFIALVGGTAVWPLAARAQQRPKMLRIGTISTLARERPTWRAFEQRLRELGYVEGRISPSIIPLSVISTSMPRRRRRSSDARWISSSRPVTTC